MQELIAFFLRFGGFITFLVLEFICGFMVVRYNDSQRSIWLHSGNTISGAISEQASEFNEFVSLREVADSLAAENARLRLQLLLQPHAIPDSVTLEPVDSSYTLIASRVVRNSTQLINNTLTINLGSKAGVNSRQGVISDRSIVGITRGIGSEYSEVISLLHSESKISAMLNTAGYYGVLTWKGKNLRHVHLNEIPRHAKIEVGDSVITSGYSSIFPKGLPIGVIDTFWLQSGNDFYDIKVRLHHDPAKLSYIYIINKEPSSGLSKFEEELANEQ